MTVELRVLSAGMASVQDLGRPGYGYLGIPTNGASDGQSARVANTLVGNAVDAPLLEVTGSAFAFEATGDVVVAVTGAAERVSVDGVAQPAWNTLVVPAGRRVAIEDPAGGLRSYVAVNGRLRVEPVLGSVAPDRLLGVGRTLRAGDTLGLDSGFTALDHPFSRIPLFRFGAAPAPRSGPLLLETTVGPDAHEFPDHLDGTLDAAYEVSPQSDHIGLRLLGPTPERTTAREILSRGVPVGAIEVPPAGGLLLLLRGRLVTAGYPVVAVATTESVDRLGQVRPGEEVRFHVSDPAQARAAVRRRDDELRQLATRVRSAFGQVGLGHVLAAAAPSPAGNSSAA